MRWIVFDDETAEVVVSQWRRGAAEISHEHPLDAALQSGKTPVLVLPSRVPGQMLVARMRVQNEDALPKKTIPLPVPVETPPTEVSERKPWWRKIVA